MLSIRLTRVGRKNAPTYRLVVMPKQRDPWAKTNEILGSYNPRANPPEIHFKADRISYWISQGAEATDTVWNLLVDQKIVTGKKRSVTNISNRRRASMEETKKTAEDAKVKAAEEAKAKAQAQVAAKAEADAASKAAAEAPAPEAPTPEVPAAEPAPETPQA